MLSVDELVDILNNEITEDFLRTAIELYEDGYDPIDPEHPDMEAVLEKVTEAMNELMDTLPLSDEYE